VRHVPLNAWFRFRRAVEDTSTVLLVLEQESNAKTCASLVLQMRMKATNWSVTGKPEHAGILPPAHARLFDGAEVQVEMLHTRVQSINMPQACNGPVSIDGRSAGRDHAYDSGNSQSFSAQSMWSYLHTLPMEAKPK
jgi:hypothetical protein